MHNKCWLLIVLFLAGTAGCRLFQKKEPAPEVAQTPVSEVEELIATPLPQEAVVEEMKKTVSMDSEPMREYPDDPRWVKISELQQKIAALEAELAAAEHELAETKAQYEQSELARKPQKVTSELGNAFDTAERRCDAINRATIGGER